VDAAVAGLLHQRKSVRARWSSVASSESSGWPGWPMHEASPCWSPLRSRSSGCSTRVDSMSGMDRVGAGPAVLASIGPGVAVTALAPQPGAHRPNGRGRSAAESGPRPGAVAGRIRRSRLSRPPCPVTPGRGDRARSAAERSWSGCTPATQGRNRQTVDQPCAGRRVRDQEILQGQALTVHRPILNGLT